MRSVRTGERWVGRFSQLPTLLGIFRFRGLFFFFDLQNGTEENRRQKNINKVSGGNVYNPY